MKTMKAMILSTVLAGCGSGCATYTARMSPDRATLREHYEAEGIYPALQIDGAMRHLYFEGVDSGEGMMIVVPVFLANVAVSFASDTLYLYWDLKAIRARKALEEHASVEEVSP